MRQKLSSDGIFLPTAWFNGAQEVEIHREDNRVVIVPVTSSDPLLGLGKAPLDEPEINASEAHDQYLYGQP